MDPLFSGLLISLATGITFIAYAHHKAYANFYLHIAGILLAIEVGACIWNSAIWGMTHELNTSLIGTDLGKSIIGLDKSIEISRLITEAENSLELSITVCWSIAGAIFYLLFLRHLMPKILALK